jgi:hypothetical protein
MSDNRIMRPARSVPFFALALALTAALALPRVAPAQDPAAEEPPAQGDSQQVEESDEAFRRRMELEDARHRDPTYVDPQAGYQRELEKIDRLPEASRDHIREQLIDLIVENGEWTPDDARREYPYAPSAAAQADPALAGQEQEAWDEQIEKYHAREAAAFGAYRGPVAGPGNPDGAEGAAESDGGGAGQAGAQGQAGDAGETAHSESGATSGTYQPYQPNRQTADEQVSTAGVSESALDFILGRQGGAPATPGEPGAAPNESAAPTPSEPPSEPSSEPSAEAQQAVPRDLRGILAIEDLDKLGPGVRQPPPPEEEEPEDPDGRR